MATLGERGGVPRQGHREPRPPPHLPGPGPIHAGLRVDSRALQHIPADLERPKKAVLAVARLADMHTDCDGRCSKWAHADAAWHWQLTDVHALTEPVHVPGAQGLWIPDDDLRRRVAAALPVAAAALTTSLIGA